MATGQLTSEVAQPSLYLSGVPVLMYHGLNRPAETEVPARERKYWIPRPQFREQLELIRQGGWRSALLGELWSGSETSDHRAAAVALTFDDGKASDYEIAFPALLEADARADFFVNTSAVGKPGHLSWQQLTEMQKAGMAFQSHGHEHIVLSRLPIRELEGQLRDSKRLLEDRLGCRVDFLAAPYGLLNRRVVSVAQQLGYRAVCTSWSWPARPGATRISRAAVYRDTTLREFHRLLNGDPLLYGARAVRNLLLYVPKQLLLRYRPAQLGVRVLEKQA